MRRRGATSALSGHTTDALQVFREERVRGPLDPACDFRVSRAAGGRVVFEAAVFGRVVRGRDDDPVSQPGSAAAVVSKDGVRDDRRGRIAAIAIDHHLDAVGGEHLQGAHKSRLGQRMGVHAHEQRAVDAVSQAIRANGLRDGQDVRFVEGAFERRATVSRRPERHTLRRDCRIRLIRVVRGHQPRNVHQQRGRRRLSSQRTERFHRCSSLRLIHLGAKRVLGDCNRVVREAVLVQAGMARPLRAGTFFLFRALVNVVVRRLRCPVGP